MWSFFARITSSGTPLPFLLQPLSSFVSISLPSPVAAHVTSLVWWQGHSQVCYFFYYSIYVWLKFHFQHYPFFLCYTHFHLDWPITFSFSFFAYPFWWNVMWIYHWGTRRQHSETFCCLWELNERLIKTVTNQRQVLKEVMRLVTDHKVHLSSVGWGSSEVVLSAGTHSSYTVFNWNLLEDWCYSKKSR